MSSAGTISVTLKAFTAEYSKAIEQAAKDLEGWESRTKAAAKAAGAAFLGLTAGLALAFKESSEAELAMTKLSAAAKAAGTSMDTKRMQEFASALEKVSIFGDDTTIAASAMLTSFGLTQTQIEKLMPRIADFASLTGTDLATAAQAVGRSVQSGTNALQRQGLVMTDGQQKTFQAATATERLSYMMGLLSTKAGGASAAVAGTAAGAIMQFQNSVSNLAEEIGTLIQGPIADFARDVTSAIQSATTWLQQLDPETRKMIGNFLIGATVAAGLAAAIAGILMVLPSLQAGFAIAGGIITGALLPAVGVIALIAGAIAGVILYVGLLHKAWDSDFGYMRTIVTGFARGVMTVWKFMVDKITGLWNDFVAGFAAITGKDLGAIATSAGDGILAGFDSAWEDVKAGATDAAKFVKDAMKSGLADLGLAKLGAQLKAGFSGLSLPGAAAPVTPTGPNVVGGTGTIPVSSAEGAGSYADQGPSKIKGELNSAGDAMVIAGEQLSGKLGATGDMVSAAAQGFQAGGPWGALIAVVVQLLSSTQGFMDIVGSLNESIQEIVQALNPIMEGLKPLMEIVITVVRRVGALLGQLAKSIGPLLAIVGNMLIPIFKALDPVFEGLYYVVTGVALLVAYIAKGIGQLWNGILEGVARLFDAIANVGINIPGDGRGTYHPFGFAEDWADSVRDGQVSMDGLNDAIDDITSGKFDDTMTEIGSATEDATGATEDFTQTMQSASEELTNVPQGYKVAMARFNAMAAVTPTGGSSLFGLDSSADEKGSRTTIFENVHINSRDGRDMYEQFKKWQELDNFMKGGSPVPPGPGPYSTPRSR